jgi:hypothetical protein
LPAKKCTSTHIYGTSHTKLAPFDRKFTSHTSGYPTGSTSSHRRAPPLEFEAQNCTCLATKVSHNRTKSGFRIAFPFIRKRQPSHRRTSATGPGTETIEIHSTEESLAVQSEELPSIAFHLCHTPFAGTHSIHELCCAVNQKTRIRKSTGELLRNSNEILLTHSFQSGVVDAQCPLDKVVIRTGRQRKALSCIKSVITRPTHIQSWVSYS